MNCIGTLTMLFQNLHHHFEALGGWSWVLKDYYYQNLTAYLDDPGTQRMADIIDPISKAIKDT